MPKIFKIFASLGTLVLAISLSACGAKETPVNQIQPEAAPIERPTNTFVGGDPHAKNEATTPDDSTSNGNGASDESVMRAVMLEISKIEIANGDITPSQFSSILSKHKVTESDFRSYVMSPEGEAYGAQLYGE